MTPAEQITLSKAIESRAACQNQEPTPIDLKVQYMALWFNFDIYQFVGCHSNVSSLNGFLVITGC